MAGSSTSKSKPAKKPAKLTSDLISSKIRQKLKLPSLPYKLAKVCRDPNEWFVYYQYRHPVTKKFCRFRSFYGLNGEENLPFREQNAKHIIEVINEELRAGFNPFNSEKVRKKYGLKPLEPNNEVKETIEVQAVPAEERENKNLVSVKKEPSLTDAFPRVLSPHDTIKFHIQQLILKWRKTETNSQNATYLQMSNRFIKYLNATDRLLATPSEINLEFADSFREFMMADMKLKPKTVNTTLSHIGMFFDELKRDIKDLNNPFRLTKHVTRKSYRGIDIDLDTEEDDYIPFTTEELEAAFKYIGENARHLLRFYSLVYWGFMRIVEVTRLQISDIDLKAGTIRVKGPDAKNRTAAYIQILPPMRLLLEEMNLDKYPSDYYLFTTGNLVPGPIKYSANAASNRWKDTVYEKLKIRKKPYSLKHTGNIHHILQNKGRVDREWMQKQNKHKTRAQLDKYIERLNIYIIDETQYNFPSSHLINPIKSEPIVHKSPSRNMNNSFMELDSVLIVL